MKKAMLCLAAGLLASSTVSAGEKKLMHCFAFTELEGATKADWDAFYKATDELPKKIKGIDHVWYGKLAHPLTHNNAKRTFGVCMEMDNAEVREKYGKDPAHTAWDAAYAKVHVEGTTTYDILGQ
ncbi:MAG TPA: Dabb family protein [Bryobacteraceae bacterium]|nr:Dabb family protein [Bryobacteraceae bacterium]